MTEPHPTEDSGCDWCGGKLSISKENSKNTLCSPECANEWKEDNLNE